MDTTPRLGRSSESARAADPGSVRLGQWSMYTPHAGRYGSPSMERSSAGGIRWRMAWAARLAVVAGVALAGGAARAEGVADEADLHFHLGAEAYARNDYRGALEHFFLSNRLVPNRNVVFNIARTFEQMKRYADAHRHYADALAGETDPRAVGDVNAALARIAPNVAVLDVTSTPPGATIYLDRKDLGSRDRAPRPLALPP